MQDEWVDYITLQSQVFKDHNEIYVLCLKEDFYKNECWFGIFVSHISDITLSHSRFRQKSFQISLTSKIFAADIWVTDYKLLAILSCLLKRSYKESGRTLALLSWFVFCLFEETEEEEQRGRGTQM